MRPWTPIPAPERNTVLQISPRLRRLAALTAIGMRGLLIFVLGIGALVALVAAQLGPALLLAAVAGLAVWRLRAAWNRRPAKPVPLSSRAGGMLEDLDILGWTVRGAMSTPHGRLSYLAAAAGDVIAFAVMLVDRRLETTDLHGVAAIADWIAAAGIYPAVVPVLVGGELRDLEHLEGPVLVVSADRLLSALDEAARHAREASGVRLADPVAV